MEGFRAQCPVPGFAEALEPYIKTRQEAAQIRDRIRAQLEHDLWPEQEVRLTTINLHDPGVQVSPDAEASPGLTGVHKAYFDALKAHTAAQVKYNALKADLEKTWNQPPAPDRPVPSAMFEDDLLPLLRERERHRRLQIIERAYNDIDTLSEGLTSMSVDRVIARDLGPPPEPPSPENTRAKPTIDVEARITELKKALLTARNDTHRAPPRTPSAKSLATKTPEIVGLEEALHELTIWMEDQLAIMSDPTNNAPSSPSTDSPSQFPDSTHPHPTGPHPGPPETDVPDALEIQDLYSDYITARETLIQTIRHPPIFDPTATIQAMRPSTSSPSSSNKPSSRGNTNPDPRESPAEILLPYIPALVAAKTLRESESSHQANFQRQIDASEAAHARLLARLAGESHLVAPGATRGKDWADASMHANKKLDEFVEQRIQAGQKAVQGARRRLVEIAEMEKIVQGRD